MLFNKLFSPIPVEYPSDGSTLETGVHQDHFIVAGKAKKSSVFRFTLVIVNWVSQAFELY